MKSPFTSKKHPNNQSLLTYAEGLVDNQASFEAAIASHLKTCDSCQQKVHEICESMLLVNEIEAIEPMGDLTASILLAAKSSPRHSRGWIHTAVLAASFVFVANLGLGFITEEQPNTVVAPTQEAANLEKQLKVEKMESEAAITIEEMTKKYAPVAQSTPAEDLIAPAVLQAPHHAPSTEHELNLHRAMNAYDSDMEEARKALENNPALVRAFETYVSSQENKDEALVSVYMDAR